MQICRPIFCNHPESKEIEDYEGELICKICGVVKGRNTTNQSQVPSQSRTLFLNMNLGTLQNKKLRGTNFIKPDSNELKNISNVCNLLHLPESISRDVWIWYTKIKKQIKTTKVKILMLVIYQLCRYSKIPINEHETLSVIKSQLKVKNVHSSLNVLSEFYSFLDKDNIPIIEKIGFAQFTTHDPIFLLRSKIKTLNDIYPPEIVSKINDIAVSISLTISGSPEQVAKKSFSLAKQRCGL